MDPDTQRYACLRVELEKKVRALPGLISTDNQACFSFPPVLTPLSRPEGVDRHRAESNGQILGLPAITQDLLTFRENHASAGFGL